MIGGGREGGRDAASRWLTEHVLGAASDVPPPRAFVFHPCVAGAFSLMSESFLGEGGGGEGVGGGGEGGEAQTVVFEL